MPSKEITVNDEVTRIRNKAAVAFVRNYPNICVERQGKTREKLVSVCSSFSNYIFGTI
jgi:hypothetical protein